MANRRNDLIRQCFEHERDFHYVKFREHHWELPEIVAKCPDPAVRETMLRGFWNQDAEKRYPEYRAAVAGMSLLDLENEREHWIEKLDALGMLELQKHYEAEARIARPANDNKRSIKP